MQVAYQVLRLLSPGNFYSGESLAKKCHVSRARIWQAIELLREYGLEIHAVKGKGYSLLNAIELLSKEAIQQHISPQAVDKLTVEVLNQTDSTNDYVKRSLPHINPNHLTVAEGQVKGRGRMGRGWYSPLTKNIAMSYYATVKVPSKDLGKLSLMVACCVMNSIVELIGDYPGLGIKWPNDIWYNGSKLCGILIDSFQDKSDASVTHLIIGIGINTHKLDKSFVVDDVTSIEEIIGRLVSRNQLVAIIVNHLAAQLEQCEQIGFSSMMDTWNKYDLLNGREVTITQGKDTMQGLCKGINPLGALMVQHNNITKSFLSADVKVRPNATIG